LINSINSFITIARVVLRLANWYCLVTTWGAHCRNWVELTQAQVCSGRMASEKCPLMLTQTRRGGKWSIGTANLAVVQQIKQRTHLNTRSSKGFTFCECHLGH